MSRQSLARTRVGLACLLLLDLLDRLRDWRAFYTDSGVLSRADHYLLIDKVDGFCPSMFSDQAAGHFLVILAGFLAIGGLAVGRRWGTAAAWLWLLSLHNRNPLLLDDADSLARMLLFWGLFLGWHDRRAANVRGAACFAYLVGWASAFWFGAHHNLHLGYPEPLRGAAYVTLVLGPILLFFEATRKAGVIWMALWLAGTAALSGPRFPLVAAVGLVGMWPSETPTADLPRRNEWALLFLAYSLAWAMTDLRSSPLRLSKGSATPGQLLHLDAKWNKIPPFPGDQKIRFEVRSRDGKGTWRTVWPANPPTSYRWMRYYAYLATEPRFLEPFRRYLTQPGSQGLTIWRKDAGETEARQVL